MSKVKKFSTKGMKNYGYLGRFNKQKFLDDGHNSILDFIQEAFKFSEGPLGRIFPQFSAGHGFKGDKPRSTISKAQAVQMMRDRNRQKQFGRR